MTPQWRNRAMVVGPYFTLCTTEQMFLDETAKLGWRDKSTWAPENGARTHHGVNADGEPTCVVCIRDGADHAPIPVAGLLVHEAVHIFQRWCDVHGEQSPSNEFQAYSIQWISQELMEEFVRQTGGGDGNA